MLPFAHRITSPHNPKVAFVRSLHTGKGRKAAQAFLIEGPHLIQEAARAHIRPDLVMVDPATVEHSPLKANLAFWEGEGVEVFAVPPEIMARVSEAQTPQGIIAVVTHDRVAPERLASQRQGRFRPLVLVLDDISDPGNAGTILRSALAADVDVVLLTPNCVDAFAPKVVRAASGAHFHLPIRIDQSWNAVASLLAGAPAMRQVLVADAAGDTDYAAIDYTQRTAIIIGNEARGPSAAARARATRHIRIPMYNHVESLNAGIAASIILFEGVRQRRAAETHETHETQ
jgi:TrmH family RNA methyltransferase